MINVVVVIVVFFKKRRINRRKKGGRRRGRENKTKKKQKRRFSGASRNELKSLLHMIVCSMQTHSHTIQFNDFVVRFSVVRAMCEHTYCDFSYSTYILEKCCFHATHVRYGQMHPSVLCKQEPTSAFLRFYMEWLCCPRFDDENEIESLNAWLKVRRTNDVLTIREKKANVKCLFAREVPARARACGFNFGSTIKMENRYRRRRWRRHK